MEEKKTWDILSLSSIPLIMTLGNSMLIPVLPQIEKELQISAFQVSLIITIYSFFAIVCIPIAGYISDQIGRKKVIIPSLILSGLGGLIAGLASWKMTEPYALLIIGRILQGIGAAGAAPIVMPLVGDMFSSDDEVSKGLGMIETSNTLGKVLSPIIGALIASIIWFAPFFSFPILCLISIVLTIFLVKEPEMKGEKMTVVEFVESLKLTFKREGRWLYSIFVVGGICMFVLFGILFYLSTMLEETYRIDGVRKGIVLAIPLAALCFSSFATGKAIGEDKIKMKWFTVFGLSLLTVAVFVISFSKDIYILLNGLLASGIGIGFALPCLDAMITQGIEMSQRGSITSFYSSMRFVGVALGPPTFALLMKKSHFLLFSLSACISLVAVIIVLFAIKPEQTLKITW